jgi:hypothetical protein
MKLADTPSAKRPFALVRCRSNNVGVSQPE